MVTINWGNPNEHLMFDPYKGLNEEERMLGGCLQGVAFIVMLLVGLLLCALLGSCTTVREVVVTQQHTDTMYVTKHQRDSVWLHDSTFIKEKGDTFWVERWHTKYVEKQIHDTTYISKTDSVPKPFPVTEYVERPLSKIEKGLMGVGILTLMALVIFVAMKIKRFLP